MQHLLYSRKRSTEQSEENVFLTPASLGEISTGVDEVGETVGGDGSPTESTKMRRSSRPKRQAHELIGECATPPAKSENPQRKRESKHILEPWRGSAPALVPRRSLFLKQSDVERFENLISPDELEEERHLFV